MTTTRQVTEQCPGCSRKKVLKSYGDSDIVLCNECKTLADILAKRPGQLDKVMELTSAPKQAKELPDVLDAVRYRTVDRERNTWYVSVSELDGAPVEIFASTAFDRDQHLQSRISNLTTITRLISLILRHVFLGEKLTLEKTLTQLNRSSRQRNDLPEMLGAVLEKYSEKPQEIKKEADELP